MIKHLIFDFYGTLADTNASLLSIKRSELLRFGLKRWMIEDRDEESYFAEFANKYEVDEDTLRKEFIALEKSTLIFKGVVELLTELKKDYKIHLLTNAGRGTKAFVEQSPLKEIFTTTTYSFLEGYVKPQTECFEAVLKKANATPEECIMIGDSKPMDMRGAQKVGMKTIWFDGRKHSMSELRKAIQEMRQ